MSGSVLQSGAVTQGHLVTWGGNGTVVDGGSPLPPNVATVLYNMGTSGATGNGITDDVVQIQYFLNSISTTGGGTVLMPPDVWYAIASSSLTIPQNVTISGSYNAFGANPSDFFGGGGFLINPSLPVGIIMSGATSLTNCKVYRQGLIANATTTQVNAAVAVWAAEAVRLVTTATTTAGTVLTFAATTGVTVGMPVSGSGVGVGTVVVSTSLTTVTVNLPVTVTSGWTVRFGGSVGILNPTGTTGVVFDQLRVIGFNTGIITGSAQHFYSRIEADNIYNMEWYRAGDGCWASKLHFIPWYGQDLNLIPPRPGDSIFVHDAGVGLHINSMESFGWQNGVHLKNGSGLRCLDILCETQGALTTGANCKGFWVETWTSGHFHGCHAQGQSYGFHLFDSTIMELVGCSASGGAIGGTAHYYVENPTVSGRMGILDCSSYGTTTGMYAFVFAPGMLAYCRFIPGFIINIGIDPPILIDPSVSTFINRVNTRDDLGMGASMIQSYLREKLYIEGSGVATTDGSPTAPLTVKLQDGSNAQAQIISFLRNNAQAVSLEMTQNSLYILPNVGLFLGKPNLATTIQGTTIFSQWYQQANISQSNPSSGGTISWATFVAGYIINSSGTLGSLTINLPATPPDRLVLKAIFAVAVTTLTIATTDGAGIKPTIATAAAGTAVNFVFNINLNTWFVWA